MVCGMRRTCSTWRTRDGGRVHGEYDLDDVDFELFQALSFVQGENLSKCSISDMTEVVRTLALRTDEETDHTVITTAAFCTHNIIPQEIVARARAREDSPTFLRRVNSP